METATTADKATTNNATENKRRHIVIIGGGFGGINAAKKLAKADVDITLIDKNNHHLFQPLLYQVATAALSPGDIAEPIRAILGDYPNVEVLLAKVDGVDEEGKAVLLSDGRRIDYDSLVMAAGAQYNYFGNDSWEQHAPGLKSVADALKIRERILLSLEKADQIPDPEKRKKYLRFVVIGGGPTGVEMAGAIAEIAKRNMMRDYHNFERDETEIYLLEAAPQILNGYPENLARKGQKMLEDMGVIVKTGTPVTHIEENKVFTNDGLYETPNIIWGAGVVANPVFKTLNAERDKAGRVKVGSDLSLPNNPDIFVIGDAAHAEDEDGNVHPALAPAAVQMGKYVAKILSKEESARNRGMRAPFKYVDKGTMATIGRARAVADIKGLHLSGFVAWMLWSVVHVLFLVGFRNRLNVFVEWIWFYFTFRRGIRLITDRPEEKITETNPVEKL